MEEGIKATWMYATDIVHHAYVYEMVDVRSNFLRTWRTSLVDSMALFSITHRHAPTVLSAIVHFSCSSAVLCSQVLVRLEGTNITNCTAEHPLVATGGTRIATDVFYSDQEFTVFMPEIRANTTTTQTLTQAPDEFLRSNDTFIVDLKQVSYESPPVVRGFFLCDA